MLPPSTNKGTPLGVLPESHSNYGQPGSGHSAQTNKYLYNSN